MSNDDDDEDGLNDSREFHLLRTHTNFESNNFKCFNCRLLVRCVLGASNVREN